MTPGRLYRNAGAPFTASTGERIARGQVFAPTPGDLARRRYKLHAVAGPGVAGVRTVSATAVEVPAAPATPSLTFGAKFPGVDFASDKAFELAREHDLPATAFAPGAGSGLAGAFTASDVRAMITAPSVADEAAD